MSGSKKPKPRAQRQGVAQAAQPQPARVPAKAAPAATQPQLSAGAGAGATATIGGLGVEVAKVLAWFEQKQDMPYVLLHVSEQSAKELCASLGLALRRCYITDSQVAQWAAARSVPASAIVASKLPDAGSTMSGDFGEFLVFLIQAARAHPRKALGPKKWRLKQDRTKPAPYSDVIHFVVPSWPTPSVDDLVLCSEVKTKATKGPSTPVPDAINDSVTKDQTGRLAKTLVWLKERSMTEDLGEVTVAHLERFINATAHPPSRKEFHAVAVVCESVAADELKTVPTPIPVGCTLFVVSVPQLQATYTALFDEAGKA